MQSRYFDVYEGWQKDPEGFWKAAATAIDWFIEPEKVFDEDQGVYGRWFTGGETNTCYNCLDRHVAAGRGGLRAFIHDSAMTGKQKTFTYAEVLDEVKAIAAAMRDLGIEKGDRVVIYMPMVPEAIFSMLACARLGAVHSVVFGGFAAQELAARLNDLEAKLVVGASCGLEPGRVVAYKPLIDQAIELARVKPKHCLILQREQLQAELRPERGNWISGKSSRRRGAGMCHACRSRRPIRSTSSTPPGRRASRRASCATMAGTWWRSPGAWRTFLA